MKSVIEDQLTRVSYVREVRWLVHRFEATSDLEVDLRIQHRGPGLDAQVTRALSTAVAAELEGLGRYSRATGIVLALNASDTGVSLTWRDDGVGLLSRQGGGLQTSPHAAIRRVRRAVEPIGGSVRLAYLRPRGLLLRTVIPVRAPAVSRLEHSYSGG